MDGRDTPGNRPLPQWEGPVEAKLRTWVQCVRTFYRIHRQITSVLTRHEITMPQFDVLATLRFSEGVTQQELAERLLVTKGNVCGVIDRLERLGWVERRPDPSDRRANRLHLTAAGRKKIGSVLPDHDAVVARIIGALPDQEVKRLRILMETLERASNDER